MSNSPKIVTNFAALNKKEFPLEVFGGFLYCRLDMRHVIEAMPLEKLEELIAVAVEIKNERIKQFRPTERLF